MPYNYEWPYVNSDKYNSDWLLNNVKANREDINKNTDDIATLQNTTESLQQQIDALVTGVRARKIVYIGDSYMVGIGSTLNVIPETIKQYIPSTYWNFAVGGTGFIRPGSENKPFLSQLQEAAIDTSINNSEVTDVVVVGGYNDLGVKGTEQWSELAFINAVKQIAITTAQTFVNAKLTIIPLPWVIQPYNDDFTRLHNWLCKGCAAAGCNYAEDAINWLINLPADYTTDGVHPSSLGYNIIAPYIASTINGKDPSRTDFDLINESGNFLYLFYRNGFFCMGGNIVTDGTAKNLFTYPDRFPSYNQCANVQLYGDSGIVKGVFIQGRTVITNINVPAGTYALLFISPL